MNLDQLWNLNFNFELILFYATVVAAAIVLLDILIFAPRRRRNNNQMSGFIDFVRSIFPILLLVFLIRSFLYEAYRIPTGSLEPTLLAGDLILVNKFDYGIRLPVIHQKMIKIHNPERGDIVVFLWPPNPSYYFIKRLVGMPGDHISYVNKVLYVNNQIVPQEFEKNATDTDESGHQWDVIQKQENLLGIKHAIFQIPDRSSHDFKDLVVPENMYFMMGDNRDDSADSRFWGFVPDKNVIGKAVMVLLSWDNQISWLSLYNKFRWNRSGISIH